MRARQSRGTWCSNAVCTHPAEKRIWAGKYRIQRRKYKNWSTIPIPLSGYIIDVPAVYGTHRLEDGLKQDRIVYCSSCWKPNPIRRKTNLSLKKLDESMMNTILVSKRRDHIRDNTRKTIWLHSRICSQYETTHDETIKKLLLLITTEIGIWLFNCPTAGFDWVLSSQQINLCVYDWIIWCHLTISIFVPYIPGSLQWLELC